MDKKKKRKKDPDFDLSDPKWAMPEHGAGDWRAWKEELSKLECPNNVLKVLRRPCKCCHEHQRWAHVSVQRNMTENLIMAVKMACRREVEVLRDRFRPEFGSDKIWLDNCVETSDNKTDAVKYTSIAKLRHFGFVYRNPDWVGQGIWVITQKAIDFLRNRLRVPKGFVVWEHRGAVAWESRDRVNVVEALGRNFLIQADWLRDWAGLEGSFPDKPPEPEEEEDEEEGDDGLTGPELPFGVT